MQEMTAEKAIDRLKSGNRRFVDDRVTGGGRSNEDRERLVGGQQPFAAVLSCADSRVAPEILFDTGLGDLFVVRVAGNVANTSSIASLEYAVANLGTKLILVLAHQSCGAVGAALDGVDAGKNIDHLLAHIRPAIGSPGGSEQDEVAWRNARLNAEALVRKSEILNQAVADGGLRILSAFYRLQNGAVEFD